LIEIIQRRPKSGGGRTAGTNSVATSTAKTSGGKGSSRDDGYWLGSSEPLRSIIPH